MVSTGTYFFTKKSLDYSCAILSLCSFVALPLYSSVFLSYVPVPLCSFVLLPFLHSFVLLHVSLFVVPLHLICVCILLPLCPPLLCFYVPLSLGLSALLFI